MTSPDSSKSREKFLAVSDGADSAARMVRSGFLGKEDRKAITAPTRGGSSPCRVTRRADDLVLLDAGWCCRQFAHAPLLNDATIAAGASSSNNVSRNLFYLAAGFPGIVRITGRKDATRVHWPIWARALRSGTPEMRIKPR